MQFPIHAIDFKFDIALLSVGACNWSAVMTRVKLFLCYFLGVLLRAGEEYSFQCYLPGVLVT